MQEHEAFQLLVLASARDGRQVSQATAKVWADDLSDIGLDEAISAARAHYRESTAWLMPAHVIERVRPPKPKRDADWDWMNQ